MTRHENAYLEEDELKEAVSDWLRKKGLDYAPDFISLSGSSSGGVRAYCSRGLPDQPLPDHPAEPTKEKSA